MPTANLKGFFKVEGLSQYPNGNENRLAVATMMYVLVYIYIDIYIAADNDKDNIATASLLSHALVSDGIPFLGTFSGLPPGTSRRALGSPSPRQTNATPGHGISKSGRPAAGMSGGLDM